MTIIIFLSSLLGAMALGMPIAFALGFVAVLFMYAFMPAASGWYPGEDASGLRQTTRWQFRRRRAVSAATSAG